MTWTAFAILAMFYFEPFPSAMLVLNLNVNIVEKGFIEGVVQRSPHIIDKPVFRGSKRV